MTKSNAKSIHRAKNRPAASLSATADKNLSAYAAAASAAGVTLLALAQPMEARVIYTPAHQRISTNTGFNIDLNHDGVTDFVIQNKTYRTSNGGYRDELYLVPGTAATGANSFVGYGSEASALLRGSRVSSGVPFYYPKGLMALRGAGKASSFTRGFWVNVKNRYLGLRFTIHGRIHYGWARLNAKVSKQSGVTALLTGYAYETIANRPIITGKEHGAGQERQDNPARLNDPSPERVSLGRLAQGAFGLAAGRKSNSEK